MHDAFSPATEPSLTSFSVSGAGMPSGSMVAREPQETLFRAREPLGSAPMSHLAHVVPAVLPRMDEDQRGLTLETAARALLASATPAAAPAEEQPSTVAQARSGFADTQMEPAVPPRLLRTRTAEPAAAPEYVPPSIAKQPAPRQALRAAPPAPVAAAASGPSSHEDAEASVPISAAEVALYTKDKQVTGLLFRSVAMLKGMSIEEVAAASGLGRRLVEAIFESDGTLGAIKMTYVRRVANVLGFDLATKRLTDDRVHFFDLSRLPGRVRKADSWKALRGIGLLSRNAAVVELSIGTGLNGLRMRNRMHVAQSENARIVFTGTLTRKFSIDMIPGAKWACKNDPAKSVIRLENAELLRNLFSRDLTNAEFNEIFEGSKAITWETVQAAARMNNVTKRQLLDFIETSVTQANVVEVDQAVAAASRPTLRLVSEQQQLAA